MQNKNKTNKQLIKEVKQSRRRIAELKALETNHKQMPPGEPIPSPCPLDQKNLRLANA
jgi:hypothetical protein